MKARRHSAILDVIARGPVRSQEQLRRSMRAVGFDVTQATLSRDIRELGLVKGGVDGAYRQPDGGESASMAPKSLLPRSLSEYLIRVDRVQQLLVLKTGAGQAQILGVALDRARLPEIVGTLAGDDTLLVIAHDVRRAKQLVKRLEQLAGEVGGP